MKVNKVLVTILLIAVVGLVAIAIFVLNYGWDNVIEITIDHTKVDRDLSHFPVMIHLSDSCGQSNRDLSDVFTELGGNYKKIAVTKDDGETQLYVEVEKWDSANNEAWLWVSSDDLNISSSVDTTLYLYFDINQPDNEDFVGLPGSIPARNVWDANFKMVDHMQDASNSTTTDSTGNGNDGVKKASNEPVESTEGLIGNCQNFDGIDDFISENITGISDTYTVEIIFSGSDYGADLFGGVISTYEPTISVDKENQVNMCGQYYQSWLWGSGVITDNEWTYTGSVFSGTNRYSYVNGILDVSTGSGYSNQWDSNGHQFSGHARSPYYGLMDEARISDIARSDTWIKATYYTIWDNLLSLSEVISS